MPMAPLVRTFVLGGMREQNLRRAISMTNVVLNILIESTRSQGLWFSAVLMVLVPPLLRWHAHQKI